MDAPANADVFLFEEFRLDRRGLFRQDQNGAFIPIVIGSRALEVLRTLVERSGDLVSRDEILAAVWPGIVIEGRNLPVQIAALRRALDEGRADGSCIQTIPGRGYRLAVPVKRVEGQSRGHAALPHGDPGTRPRLSIVVLPFTNLSNDPKQQYFADAITEDLTTDLSRLPHMRVISSNTAFTYHGKRVDTKQIGRDLNIRYVLEGSVRRSDNQVRVNAQLIDAETDMHLWAEGFDGNRKDLFALQDKVTRRIAVELNLELVAAEAARSSNNPDVLDHILRGRAVRNRPASPDVYAEAISLLEHALALDPQSGEAQSLLARFLSGRVLDQMSDAPAVDIARAEELVGQALAVSPRSPLAHHSKGQVLRAQRRWEEAIPEYETALAFDRNSVSSLYGLCSCKFHLGYLEEVIPLMELAIRLSPRGPQIGLYYHNIGRVYLLQSRVEEAIPWLERARNAIPEATYIRAALVSAYTLKGETERAAAEFAEWKRRSRHPSIAGAKASGYFGVPKVRALHEATFFVGLRKAGVPEE